MITNNRTLQTFEQFLVYEKSCVSTVHRTQTDMPVMVQSFKNCLLIL